MFAVRLPPAIEKRLARLSKLTGRTKSYYVREALLEHLDDLEDVYLAERRLEDLRAGRSSTVPLTDVIKQLVTADDEPPPPSPRAVGAALRAHRALSGRRGDALRARVKAAKGAAW